MVPLLHEGTGLVLRDWGSYAAATAVLLAVLAVLARAWLPLRGRWFPGRLVRRPA